MSCQSSLLGIVLALIVRSALAPGPGGLIIASVCLTLMPLCNAGGLAFIPAMSLWLWWLAFSSMKPVANSGNPQSPSRLRTLSILVLSGPAVVLSVLYFKGYEAPKHHAAPGGLEAAARASVQFLGMALGRPGVVLWPWSGFMVAGLLAGSAGVMLWAWATRRDERARVIGLACVLGAVVSLALGTGWGRSGQDELAGLQPRYTTLATPALLVAYFAFACYGPGARDTSFPWPCSPALACFSGRTLLMPGRRVESHACRPRRSIATWLPELLFSGSCGGTRRFFIPRRKPCTNRWGCSGRRGSAASDRCKTILRFRKSPSNDRRPRFAWQGGTRARWK